MEEKCENWGHIYQIHQTTYLKRDEIQLEYNR